MSDQRDSHITTSEEDEDETMKNQENKHKTTRRAVHGSTSKPELQRSKTKQFKDPSWDCELPLPSLSFGAAAKIVFVCSVACYYHTYDVGFINDDIPAVLNNKDVNPHSSVLGVFSNDYHGHAIGGKKQRSYRPIVVLTYRIDQLINLAEHPNPFLSHVMNIAIYGGTCVVMMKLFSSIFGGSSWRSFHSAKASFLAALLFTLHPLHTANVSSLVGRADVLCAVFAALAFMLYMEACKKAYESTFILIGCIICTFLSVLCSEQGIAILIICSIYDISTSNGMQIIVAIERVILRTFKIDSKTANMKAAIPKKFQLVINRQKYILCSFLITVFFQWGLQGETSLVDKNVWRVIDLETFYQLINFSYRCSVKSFQLMAPLWLCCDWSVDCVPPITSPADIRLWVGVLFWACGILPIITYWADTSSTHRRLVFVSVMWISITLIASSVTVAELMSDSALFVSSAGACMLVSVLLCKMCQHPRGKKVAAVLILLLTTKYAMRTRQRTSEWRNAETLYNIDLSVCPGNAKLHYLLGRIYLETDRIAMAENKFDRALELEPDYPDAIFALGRLLLKQNRLKKAYRWIKKAIDLDSNNADYWRDLGRIQLDQGDENAAIESFERIVHLRPLDATANLHLGKYYMKQNKMKKAIAALGVVIKVDNKNKEAWTHLLDSFFKLGVYKETAQIGTSATRLFPDDAHMHHLTAVSLHKTGKYEDSEKHYLKAIKLKPREQKYHLEMAALYESWKRYDKAKDAYVKGLKLNYTNSDVWGNLFRLHVKENKIGVNLVNSEVKPATSRGQTEGSTPILKPLKDHVHETSKRSDVPET